MVEDLLQARLDTGDHRGVAAGATVAAGEEPFRERRWEILALAQYRGGRQADALASIRTARRMLGNELGLDPGSDLVVLEHSILSQDPSLAGERDLLDPSGECPWKGLSSYEARDQDAFFGRSAEIAEGLARLERHPLLVLTGPSGSGKSSLMLAGLAPALVRRGRRSWRSPRVSTRRWRCPPPGSVSPATRSCSSTSSRRPSRWPGRRPTAAWLAELASYAESRSPVAVTLRADQMAHLTVSPASPAWRGEGVLLVAPLQGPRCGRRSRSRRAGAGLRLEHGLVDLLIRDTEGQPGALPLLSHALVETGSAGTADC